MNEISLIHTERLLIRKPRLEDAPAINDAVVETFEELKPWMPWAQAIVPVEDTAAYIQYTLQEWETRTRLDMVIFNTLGNHYIGGTGFHTIDWGAKNLQIGYWIRKTDSGKGYITEAVNALTKIAFNELGMHRIEIRCDTNNTKSCAVAERCGFTKEAVLKRNALTADGKHLRDTVIYVKFAHS